MKFILTGFKQDQAFRVFAFEGGETDQTRSEYTVRADLALIRQYGIPIQDLPLLCRGLLEKRLEGETQSGVTFTEDQMRLHAQTCRAAIEAAILKKRSARRPTTSNQTGVGWRATQAQRT